MVVASADQPCAGPDVRPFERPCEFGKTVPSARAARGSARCPDCQLAHRRAVVHDARATQEEADRLARIESAAPPASTFDGQLQRFRDRAREDDGLEPAWNGTMSREGKSLTSDGMGSSLGPGAGFRAHV